MFSPIRHCQMAECSLSTGNSFAPDFSIAHLMISPAMTRLSLLDKATSTPASMAYSVGSMPRAPTSPFSTISTSSLFANSKRPALPFNSSISDETSAFSTVKKAVSSTIHTAFGWNWLACSINNAEFLLAVK